MSELNEALIEGRHYNEIQEDVVKLVNFFVNKFYDFYPVLKQHNCDRETVVNDVYRGLYLKTKEDNLSNLERHFIKASKINNITMSYISNLIRKSVKLSLMCLSRELTKKPIVDSLDRVIIHSGEKDTVLSDIITNNDTSMEKLVEMKILLESINHKTYKDYYYYNSFDKKIKLSTKKVLDWIISGYKISEMRDRVFKKEDNSNINFKVMSDIKKETISLVKDVFI